MRGKTAAKRAAAAKRAGTRRSAKTVRARGGQSTKRPRQRRPRADASAATVARPRARRRAAASSRELCPRRRQRTVRRATAQPVTARGPAARARLSRLRHGPRAGRRGRAVAARKVPARTRPASTVRGVAVRGAMEPRYDEVLTADGARLRGRPASQIRHDPQALARAARRAADALRRRRAARLSWPRRARFATTTGRWRRSRPTCSIAASRSPARSTARWSSTRSIPAPRSTWRISRTPTRRPGPTMSRARSI